MEELKKYTGKFQALWDNYFWAKEQIEHRKNTIGMDSTPEEKVMCLDFIEWAEKQSWNLEDQDTTNE